MKKVFLFLIFISVFTLNAADFDKDVIVLDQSRNDKVKTVFKEMMDSYQEGDATKFFTYVSEDRFEQDYMTFYEAIDEDMRVYEVLSIETWVNKITEDGVKRYLYVQWDKRYESTQSSSGNEINQRGLSRFLFDEVNGQYKLIELAGNNFWGASLPEWREEVPQIAGQEAYDDQEDGNLPDLIITSAVYDAFNYETIVTVKNQGYSDIVAEVIVVNNSSESMHTYSDGISAGESVPISMDNYGGSSGELIEVDPYNAIAESNEDNNNATSTSNDSGGIISQDPGLIFDTGGSTIPPGY